MSPARDQRVSVQQQRTATAEPPHPMGVSHDIVLADCVGLKIVSHLFESNHPSQVTPPRMQPFWTHASPMLVQ